MEAMQSFSLDIPSCCERMCFLICSLNQAKNLGLSNMYINELQTLLLSMIHLDQDQLKIKYDEEIDAILLLRGEAFDIYKNELMNRHIPIAKTIIE